MGINLPCSIFNFKNGPNDLNQSLSGKQLIECGLMEQLFNFSSIILTNFLL